MALESPENLVSTALGAPLSSTATSVTLVNAASTGFTNAQYHVLIMNGLTIATSTQFEIALATGLSSNTLTLGARSVEPVAGTQTAYSFASGSTIMASMSVGSVLALIAQATIPGTQVPNVVVLVANSATPTVNTDTGNIFSLVGLSQNVASWTTNLSGYPVHGQEIRFEITDNGTGRTMVWGASFASPNPSVATWPTGTTANTIKRADGTWNSVTSTWDCLRVV